MKFAVRSPLKRARVIIRSVVVMSKAELIKPTRPIDMLRAVMDLRRLGPAGGPVRIAGRRHPDALGLVDERGEITFGELDRRSNALARAWREKEVDEHSVVALLCRDHRGLVEGMAAAGKLGASVVLMNTGFGARQLAEVAEREGVTDIVFDEEFTDTAAALPLEIRRYVAWSDDPDAELSLEQMIEATSGDPLPLPSSPGSFVMLTSGTTGVPKGAQRQVRSPLAPAQFLDRIPLRPGGVTVLAAPIFHGTGLSQFLMSIALGSATVLRRRFDPEAALAAVEKYDGTAIVLVPTMLQRVLDLGPETLNRYETSSLRIVLTAGSALPPDLGNRACEAFGDVLYNLYGSTECSFAAVAMPEDWHAAPGTVGLPPVGCRVEIYTSEGTRVFEPHEKGTVYIGSGMQFAGYTGGGSKDEINGLLSSGDVGHFDEAGRLFIDGRADDMIVSGGENVYPGEVENVLMEHPLITEAAVLGVPDDDFGQRLKAFVVIEPDADLSSTEIRDHVKSNLARFKVPREVTFLDQLPRNPTGKLLRGELR